jgi:hypothetical protein
MPSARNVFDRSLLDLRDCVVLGLGIATFAE